MSTAFLILKFYYTFSWVLRDFIIMNDYVILYSVDLAYQLFIIRHLYGF